MISGYFYNSIVSKHNTKKQILKIIKIILLSNLLYFIFNGIVAIINNNFTNYFSTCFNIKAFIRLLLFNLPLFEGHLWYLNSFLYVLIIMLIFKKRRILHFFIPILLTLNLIFGNYSNLFLGKTIILYITRNFLTCGLPFFLLGDIIKEKENFFKNIFSIKESIILIIVFSVLTLLENFTLIKYDIIGSVELYASTIFLSFFIFILTINCENKIDNKLFKNICKIGKKYSLTIYIIHPAFITLFNIFLTQYITSSLLSDIYIKSGPIIIFLISYFFSIVLDNINKIDSNKK